MQLLLAVLLASASAAQLAVAQKATPAVGLIPQLAKYDGKRPGSSAATPATYVLDVTAGRVTPAPDCYDREVILVNGHFMPTLEVTQGDYVEITVKNNIPARWPAVTLGITIHWHGFSMHGVPFMDGTRYVSQCPIGRGTSFTYKFRVNEMPGTYFWHDHAAMYRADGLQGALIVREAPGAAVLYPSDAEHTLTLADWWHFPGNSMAMRLSRPFDPSKVANESGYWCWVGLPKAILVNGRGNYYQCEDVFKRQVGAALPYTPKDKPVVAKAQDLMQPSPCIAGQLGPKAEFPLCSITEGAKGFGVPCAQAMPEFELIPGKVHRIRMINAAMLVYLTVCFEKHTVTVVALDAAPVTPKDFKECVDVNTGQRVDVLIKADQPAGSYWVSVAGQYRKGSPSGYAVLRYKGSKQAPNPDTIMQPGTAATKMWSTQDTMSFTAPEALLKKTGPAAKSYIAPAVPGQPSWVLPKKDADRRYVIHATQPLLEGNGILRWALNSVAHTDSPPCSSVIQDVHENPGWSREHALTASAVNSLSTPGLYFTPFGGNPKTWLGSGNRLQVVDAATTNAYLLNDMKKPGAATHILTVEGEAPVVEVVIQNDRAGLYGGEYASANNSLTNERNGREQHSFHLHGYHFWVVGMGMGEWTPDKVGGPEYNLVNPALRDSATVLFAPTGDKLAWVAFRFKADNPGVWPLHCHIAFHQVMGQGLNVIVNPPAIAKMKVPELPSCPSPCPYDFANFAPKAAQSLYGNKVQTESSKDAGMLPPDDSNLP